MTRFAALARLTSSDRLLGGIVGLFTLLLYLRTLLPHTGGTEDVPKFQYLGKVLGSAHNPGYPLYVMVSHVFSWLPIGTLAYRINVMSAFFAAVTVMLVFFIARRVGAHRALAIAAGILVASGRSFWSNSVMAEVYSLNTALWCAAILKLLDWRKSGRDGDLYWATAFVALGLGHHLTILGIFPAALVLLLLSGHKWLRPRLVLTCAAILLGGVSQYLFILIRTRQGASYMESGASSLSQLWDVMTARTYSNAMFSMDLETFITWRIPDVWFFVDRELGWLGLTAAAIGLGWLLVRNRAAGALLGVGTLGVCFLTANFMIADNTGFLLPAFATMWILTAAGFEYLRTIGAARWGRAASVAVSVVALGFAGYQVSANYRVSDRHRQTFHSEYFAAVFEQLPPGSALIIEDYWPEQIVHYGNVSKDFGGEGPRLIGSDPGTVRNELEAGHAVYAFPKPAAALRGMGFLLEPVTLFGTPLGDYLERIDNGRLIVVAANVRALPPEFQRRFRGSVLRPPGTPMMMAVGLMTSRANAPASVDTRSVDRVWPAGEVIEGTSVRLPVTIHTSVSNDDDRQPIIRIGEDEVTGGGADILVVVLDPDGRVEDARRFDASRGFRDLLTMGEWPLERVTSAGTCVSIGDAEWHDVTDMSKENGFHGRLDNYRPFESTMTLYLASEWPLLPRLGEFSPGCQVAQPCPKIDEPAIEVTNYQLDRTGERDQLARDLNADGLVTDWPTGARHVSRAVVRVNDQGQFLTYWLGFGGVPSKVWARALTDGPTDRRAGICASAPPALFDGSTTSWSVSPVNDRVVDLGRGWHSPEFDRGTRIRWTSELTAVLLVPLARTGPIRVTLNGRGSDVSAQSTVQLTVNGSATNPQSLSREPGTYQWIVPATAWRTGLNHVAIEVSLPGPQDSLRDRLVAISGIEFELLSP